MSASHPQPINTPALSPVAWLVVSLAWACVPLCGCGPQANPGVAADEQLPWSKQGLDCHGAKVDLGARVTADEVEPIARLVRDGKPVASAMVFQTLLRSNGEAVSSEQALVYVPSKSGSAYYGRSHIEVPNKSANYRIRFRVVLPDQEKDWVQDLEYSVVIEKVPGRSAQGS